MNERRAIRILEAAVVVAVAAILLSEALLYIPPGPGGVSVSITLQGEGNGTVVANYTLLSGEAGHFLAGVYWLNATFPLTRLYFFFDQAYPTSDSSLQWWYGLSLHLEAVAQARNYPLTTVYLNASQLANFLRGPPIPGTGLVIASGVLPHTVFNNVTNNPTNLVEPWIRAGGNLLWFGDRIGLWSGYPGEPLSFPGSKVGTNGTRQFLTPSIFGGGPVSGYANHSTAAGFFGFDDLSSVPQAALNSFGVAKASGTVIGNSFGNFTNAAVFPQGRGQLTYFAIPIDASVPTLVFALTNIVQSGLVEANLTLLATSGVVLRAGVSFSGSWTVVVSRSTSPIYPYATSDVCFAIFQTDYLATFGYATCSRASSVLT
jgi:hypothetical protein